MNLDPNTWMVIGAGVLALLFFSGPITSALNPAFVDKAKSGLSSLNPLNLLSGSSSSPNDIHGLVAKIMDYFTERKDSKGLMLAVGIGQHVYQQQVDELNIQLKAERVVLTPSSPQEKS